MLFQSAWPAIGLLITAMPLIGAGIWAAIAAHRDQKRADHWAQFGPARKSAPGFAMKLPDEFHQRSFWSDPLLALPARRLITAIKRPAEGQPLTLCRRVPSALSHY